MKWEALLHGCTSSALQPLVIMSGDTAGCVDGTDVPCCGMWVGGTAIGTTSATLRGTLHSRCCFDARTLVVTGHLAACRSDCEVYT
jgi:hypothetical protein